MVHVDIVVDSTAAVSAVSAVAAAETQPVRECAHTYAHTAHPRADLPAAPQTNYDDILLYIKLNEIHHQQNSNQQILHEHGI